jgi:4-hydroxybenzoyl-CoA thioesterase
VTSHTSVIPVRWGDVDWAGIVFYPRFYEWYDLACEALFDSLGLPWPRTFPRYDIVGVPIVESGARFSSPVRYGDTMCVQATVAWVKDKTFRMEYEVSVDGRACASGFEIRAWVQRPAAPDAQLHAKPIPDEVARLLRGDPA